MSSFGVRFGQLIRRYREMQGLSASEVARDALGDEAKRSRVSELENGKVANPRAKTIDAFVVYFNIPREEVDACRTPPSPATDTGPSPDGKTKPTGPFINVPRGRQVIGRETDLAQLHQTLADNPHAQLTNSAAILAGQGGIGKSTLARAYAETYHTEYDGTLWLLAATR